MDVQVNLARPNYHRKVSYCSSNVRSQGEYGASLSTGVENRQAVCRKTAVSPVSATKQLFLAEIGRRSKDTRSVP